LVYKAAAFAVNRRTESGREGDENAGEAVYQLTLKIIYEED
jgi:hypothetical protein